jgi:hypothetical protein
MPATGLAARGLAAARSSGVEMSTILGCRLTSAHRLLRVGVVGSEKNAISILCRMLQSEFFRLNRMGFS